MQRIVKRFLLHKQRESDEVGEADFDELKQDLQMVRYEMLNDMKRVREDTTRLVSHLTHGLSLLGDEIFKNNLKVNENNKENENYQRFNAEFKNFDFDLILNDGGSSSISHLNNLLFPYIDNNNSVNNNINNYNKSVSFETGLENLQKENLSTNTSPKNTNLNKNKSLGNLNQSSQPLTASSLLLSSSTFSSMNEIKPQNDDETPQHKIESGDQNIKIRIVSLSDLDIIKEETDDDNSNLNQDEYHLVKVVAPSTSSSSKKFCQKYEQPQNLHVINENTKV
jgi:hypothetical protein